MTNPPNPEDKELWLPFTVAPFNGEYEVSSAGRVRRYGRILSQIKVVSHKNSYLIVGLSLHNKSRHYLIHRLVAQTFLVNDENKPTVNHKDGDTFNNNVNNLEWATYSENIQHAYDSLGKRAWNAGRMGFRANVTRKQAEENT